MHFLLVLGTLVQRASALAWRVLLEFKRGLASLLLVVVFAANYVPDIIAGTYEEDSQIPAARAWEYVFFGAQDAIMFLIAWALVPYKPRERRYASSLVCAWGFYEAIQRPACRLAYAMDRPSSEDTKLYAGLCDHVTGIPVYMATLYVVLIAFALNYTKKRQQ